MGKLSPYASHLKRPLIDIGIIDERTKQELLNIIPPIDPEQINDIVEEVTQSINLDSKVDKEIGKGLSTNDYTTTEKEKLTGLNFSGLTKITVGASEPSNPSVGDLWINTNT